MRLCCLDYVPVQCHNEANTRIQPAHSGPSVFSTNWSSGRERTSTLASIASQGSNGPSSPAQSIIFQRRNRRQRYADENFGLPWILRILHNHLEHVGKSFPSKHCSISKANRFRSYSVNAKEKYAEDEEDDYGSGNLTPYETQQAQLHMQLAATNAAIQQHNLAVQAFANQASSNRPRARTAGVLESPTSRLLRNYYPTASRLDNSINASDMGMSESQEYDGLPEAA